jgi:hypothetical protein
MCAWHLQREDREAVAVELSSIVSLGFAVMLGSIRQDVFSWGRS